MMKAAARFHRQCAIFGNASFHHHFMTSITSEYRLLQLLLDDIIRMKAPQLALIKKFLVLGAGYSTS